MLPYLGPSLNPFGPPQMGPPDPNLVQDPQEPSPDSSTVRQPFDKPAGGAVGNAISDSPAPPPSQAGSGYQPPNFDPAIPTLPPQPESGNTAQPRPGDSEAIQAPKLTPPRRDFMSIVGRALLSSPHALGRALGGILAGGSLADEAENAQKQQLYRDQLAGKQEQDNAFYRQQWAQANMTRGQAALNNSQKKGKAQILDEGMARLQQQFENGELSPEDYQKARANLIEEQYGPARVQKEPNLPDAVRTAQAEEGPPKDGETPDQYRARVNKRLQQDRAENHPILPVITSGEVNGQQGIFSVPRTGNGKATAVQTDQGNLEPKPPAGGSRQYTKIQDDIAAHNQALKMIGDIRKVINDPKNAPYQGSGSAGTDVLNLIKHPASSALTPSSVVNKYGQRGAQRYRAQLAQGITAVDKVYKAGARGFNPTEYSGEFKPLIPGTDEAKTSQLEKLDAMEQTVRNAIQAKEEELVRLGTSGGAAKPSGGGGGQFSSPDDVKAAVQSGQISRDQGHQILVHQFGFTD